MTYFFYDLETSGLDPRNSRIMQFAGVRTDEKLKTIGEPINLLVKLTPEVLPDPGAIMVTGITPQKTLEEGYTEAEFLKIIHKEVLTPDTVTMGFNTVRFDDEFMRYTLYRNFYDPYEWQWQDGKSRWDLIDTVRMTRALRPEGIEWAFDKSGKATNRLEELAKVNNLNHSDAHDALSDVYATIDLAKLLSKKQPKLFSYLQENRGKKAIEKLLNLKDPLPVVHSSGRLSSEFLNTTVVIPIAPHPTNPNGILVYDLRHDPTEFANADSNLLTKLLFSSREELADEGLKRLPVKTVFINKCPAVAPMGVLDEEAQKRINLDTATVEKNLKALSKIKQFGQRVHQAWEQSGPPKIMNDVDAQLYDGFINDKDKAQTKAVREATAEELADLTLDFTDERLPELLVRYKARNYPESMTADEKSAWELYRTERLGGRTPAIGLEKYISMLSYLAQNTKLYESKQFLLEELKLYAESIAPIAD